MLTSAAAAAAAAAQAEAQAGPAGMPARLRAAGAAGGLPPPPYAPLVGSETGSFAHATITSRLPAILESTIRDVEAEAAARAAAEGWDEAAAAQAAAGLEELGRLRRAILEDAPLEPLHLPGAPEQTQVLLESANACVELAVSRQLQQQQQEQPQQQQQQQGSEGAPPAATRPTWLGLPWLLVECYMYGAVHAALQRQPRLAGMDPFSRQKAAAWAKSAAAAADLASEVELLRRALHADHQQDQRPPPPPSPPAAAAPGAAQEAPSAAAQAAALAGLSMALWGNKADLSLLVNAAGLDATALAATPPPSASLDRDGAGGGTTAAAVAAAAAPSRVIVDDSAAVWAAMEALRVRRRAAEAGGGGGGEVVRVDIVLDNSGLELFADLCLADLLTTAGVADRIVLHGKPIAWFVSDTIASDLEALLTSCEAEQPPPSAQVSAAAWQPVRRAAVRWRAHLASGRWRWEAHPFWCTPAPFCWMAAAAPDLYDSLARSDVVVFKGDLNYRKLAHDCRWPHKTPFAAALQGFRPAPLVALRTLKADVVVGLAVGQSQQLSAVDPDWLVNGKWGMVQAAL
ncbi:Hairy/enhancer-of-split with YRPW motif protein 2 [Pleodorina starrii]|nr:Hairy/enhancer-of-split with YRPW motif protein 2 [Pleodorina starrii]